MDGEVALRWKWFPAVEPGIPWLARRWVVQVQSQDSAELAVVVHYRLHGSFAQSKGTSHDVDRQRLPQRRCPSSRRETLHRGREQYRRSQLRIARRMTAVRSGIEASEAHASVSATGRQLRMICAWWEVNGGDAWAISRARARISSRRTGSTIDPGSGSGTGDASPLHRCGTAVDRTSGLPRRRYAVVTSCVVHAVVRAYFKRFPWASSMRTLRGSKRCPPRPTGRIVTR
ncbi:MAG: hypothetical protein JWP75_3521 [Frondihabitans sp.]|nr:hypothetical protein [Frondihabitans sp.]